MLEFFVRKKKIFIFFSPYQTFSLPFRNIHPTVQKHLPYRSKTFALPYGITFLGSGQKSNQKRPQKLRFFWQERGNFSSPPLHIGQQLSKKKKKFFSPFLPSPPSAPFYARLITTQKKRKILLLHY